jgi:hypothetical protein
MEIWAVTEVKNGRSVRQIRRTSIEQVYHELTEILLDRGREQAPAEDTTTSFLATQMFVSPWWDAARACRTHLQSITQFGLVLDLPEVYCLRRLYFPTAWAVFRRDCNTMKPIRKWDTIQEAKTWIRDQIKLPDVPNFQWYDRQMLLKELETFGEASFTVGRHRFDIGVLK